MNSYSVNCPKCSAVLKSQRPIPAGARLKCPKCQKAFVTPQPADDELVEPEIVEPEVAPATAIQSAPSRRHAARGAADEDIDELDDIEDDEPRPRKRGRARDDDDLDDEPPPRKKKKSSAQEDRPRKKKKKKKSKSNAGLMIGLAAGGVLLLVGIVVAAFLLIGGFGSPIAQHEAAIQEMIGVMNDFIATLEGVKDRNSAQAAAPVIVDLAGRLQRAVEKAKAMPKLTPQQDADLQEKYMPQLRDAMTRMQRAGMSAGFAHGGDPTFIDAMHQLERVGRNMPLGGR